MMKRKVIATAVAALLVLGTIPSVFAETGTSSGNTTVTGAGDVNYLDLDIYAVSLPTSANLNFTLDPQGLTEIEDTKSVSLSDLKGGRIIPSAPALVTNNSSKNVKVSIKLTGITNAGTAPNISTAQFISWSGSDKATIDSVNIGTANNVLLYAAPSGVDITASNVFIPADKGYVVTAVDANQTLTFVLDSAEYTVANNSGVYTATPDAGTGHGTGILIGGYVNKNADWSHFSAASNPSTVSVQAVFTFAKDDTSSPSFDSVIPALVEPDASFKPLSLIVPVGFIGTVDPLDGGTLTVAKGTNVSKSTDFNFAGQTVTSVKYEGVAMTPAQVGNLFIFDYTGSKVGIKGGWNAATTATITFTLSGGATVYTFIADIT
ncbi:MAG: hypothetical protein LBK57_03325 [Clostridiales Family XIII bacterium]|nr:hypothetical protein [Clostridiales Family XIII bacterium]